MVRVTKFIKGSLLVELLVAFGLGSILIPVVIEGFVSARDGRDVYEQRIQAVALAKEAVEATRSVRERDWNSFAVNGTYHPVVSNGIWTLVAGAEEINEFERSIQISDYDPSIKKVDIVVSWPGIITRSVTEELYLGRYIGNDRFIETTKAQFDQGTLSGILVANNSGGELQLGAGGKADWCEPNVSAINPIDLPKNGVANGIAAIEGQVFAGTGDNASGVSFAKVDITNTDPPTGSIAATYDGYKTNGVFGDGTYAYIATDNNSKEIDIINLGQIVAGKYQEAGSFNAPGNGNGSSVYVLDNYGYMTSSVGNKLYNFNKPGGNLTLDTDGVALDGLGNKIYVVGNYAYVAINSSTNQLNIVDITNPASLVKVKSFTLDGLEAKDLFINSSGTRAFIVTSNSATKKEFFIIDISDKVNPVVLGSFDTNGMSPKGVTIVPGNKAIVVGTGGAQQYQVVDITDESAPTHCTSGGRSGGLAIATGVNGISSVLEADGDAYSYIITGDSSSELKVIEGGPGGKYSTNGEFLSQIYDFGSSVSFNRFTSTYTSPNSTTVSFQFATSSPVGGSCQNANYDFVGPDLTSNTYYSQIGQIFNLPNQCFRYKVILSTSDSTLSPVVSDITINYSP